LKKNDSLSIYYKNLQTTDNFKIDYELIDWMYENNNIIVREWLDTEPEYKYLSSKSRNWIKTNKFSIMIPFVCNNLIIGLLALGEKVNKNNYTKSELSFLENLAKETSEIVFYTLRHEALMQEEAKIKKNYEEEISSNTDKIEKLKHLIVEQAEETKKLQEKIKNQLDYE